MHEAADEGDPSLIVVFDLAGTVEDFRKAAAKVPGFDYLLEVDEEKSQPDSLFHLEEHSVAVNKPVPRTLHVVMSDAAAARQLVSLFKQWEENPRVTLRTGFNPLKQVFAQLRNVRPWSIQDRVRETGLLEEWSEDLEAAGPYRSSKRVEIELWFRSDADLRIRAEGHVRRVVSASGGQVVSSTIIAEASYHALLADIPIQAVESVVKDGAESLAVLTTDAVMFVSPYRPMSFETTSAFEPQELPTPTEADTSPPRVALLDGLPIANHPHLAGKVIVDDPDDLAQEYPISARAHGTAMASLIIRGDLRDGSQPIAGRIYVRPILTPHEFGDREVAKSDLLFPDLLHRSIKRIVDGDDGSPAAAPSVRVINLSIGDDTKVFVNRMSPAARVIDWLSVNYNVLIIVSAGNHVRLPIEIPASATSSAETLHSAARQATYASARHRGMLSPAESINAISVGALHQDSSGAQAPDTVLDATAEGAPALYSAVGLGFRGSVKPDLYMSAGRAFYSRPPQDGNSVRIKPGQPGNEGPGHLVAGPPHSGLKTGVAYTHGSSNAAALATRTAASIFSTLEDPSQVGDPFPWPDAQYHPVLVKALLVHSARWGINKDRLIAELGPLHETLRARRNLTKLLGYGSVDSNRAMSALTNRALIVGAGTLRAGDRQRFEFPLPADLRSSTAWRRLTVTLAWLTPIEPSSRKYRGVKLTLKDPDTNIIGASASQADYWPSLNGTVQQHVLDGSAGVNFGENGVIRLDVDAHSDAIKDSTPVRFALVTSLEVAPSTSVNVFDQVRAGLRIQASARTAAQVRTR
ncbi:S8 family peptidase [Rathayibacter tanaceti]|uniref:S8 family serine peptidase n=2 Tax=Rathayibacter tanaceti TaxID=1671680 RepID=A0AAE6RK60_9MICO|nr:S8 family peptidase [Rathayibacter tanaceti]QHC54614.1 S8 family serine peptidase [Rathayibacter tanaceti]